MSHRPLNHTKYNSEDCCKAIKKTFGEMYDQTIKREKRN